MMNGSTTTRWTRFAPLLVPSMAALALAGCALPEGDANPVEEVQAPIIAGSTDTSAHPQEALRTVQLFFNGASSGACSGIIMRPNVVLTAAHCVTTNERPDGPKRDASKVAVWLQYPTLAAHGTEIVMASTPKTDAALVFFDFDVTGNWENFTAFDPYYETDYTNLNLTVMGYGLDGSNANSGVLRQGTIKVLAPDDPYTMTNGWKGIGVTGNNLRVGTTVNKGDSGGPLWSIPGPAFPSAVFGVASVSQMVFDGFSTFAQAYNFRDQFRAAIAARLDDSRAVVFKAATDMTNNFQALQAVSGTAANWVVTGNALVQKANAPQAFQIQFGTFENVYVATYVTSGDDDTLGLTMRYVDKDDHYRCEVDKAHHWVRLVKRRAGVDAVLASTTWNGTFSGDWIQAEAFEDVLYCAYGSTTVVAVDDTFLIGKVGLYDHFNQGAKFSAYQSAQLAPQAGAW